MNARLGLVLLLLPLAAACSGTPAQNRDEALQAALTSARVACQVILSDQSIEREPGVDDYCRAIVNGGCQK